MLTPSSGELLRSTIPLPRMLAAGDILRTGSPVMSLRNIISAPMINRAGTGHK